MTQHFSSEREARQYCDAMEAAGMPDPGPYFHDAMALHREVEHLKLFLERATNLLSEGVVNIERAEGKLSPEDGYYGQWIAEVNGFIADTEDKSHEE